MHSRPLTKAWRQARTKVCHWKLRSSDSAPEQKTKRKARKRFCKSAPHNSRDAEPKNSRRNTMAKVFGETSTTDEVLSGVNLKGKRVLVTGVSSGLGVETARSLTAHGAQVVGAARDLKKADAATDQVREDAAANGGNFEVIALDLAGLTSVRACADALLKKGEPFDVIVANAGVMATPFGHTEDGFETQFGTNHLGHFVLVNRIAPLLRPGGRLISLASAGHRYRGIRAAAVHPGGIRTELDRHLDPAQLQAIIDRISKESTAARGEPFKYKTIPQGAATSVWAEIG